MSCPVHEKLPENPVPFFDKGEVNFKAHQVGWLLCLFFTLNAVGASIWLTIQHLTHFNLPNQQKHIVRILFMVPIYAIASSLSFVFYHEALYFQLGRDCYEALIIASFFNLLLAYLSSPTTTEDLADDDTTLPYLQSTTSLPTALQKPRRKSRKAQENDRKAKLRDVMRDVKVGKWIWPFGWVKWRPAKGGRGEGLTFLWLMRLGIMQYTILRPLTTLVAVVAHSLDMYCLASWSPAFFHLHCTIVISVSVTIAMYAVVQLWVSLNDQLKPFQPMLKFFVVKSVVFLTFWQESLLSLLIMLDVITSRTYFSAEEIAIGTSAILSCFEMAIFALLHIKAFSYKPYKLMGATSTPDEPTDDTTTSLLSKPSTFPIAPKRMTTNRWRALMEVLDLRDMAKEIWEGVGYLFHFEKIEKEIFEERRRNDLLEGGFEERSGVAKFDVSKEKEVVKVDEKERERRKLKKSRIKSSPEESKHERFATLDSVELSDLPIPQYDDSLLPPHRLSGFVTSNSHSPSIVNQSAYSPSISRPVQSSSTTPGSRLSAGGQGSREERGGRARESRGDSRQAERGLPPGARQGGSGFIFERY